MGLEKHIRLLVAIFFAAVLFLSCIVEQNYAQESKKKTFRETIEADNVAIDEWKPPDFMNKLFPYYFAGYDFDDHPIWFFKFGKFDLRGYFEGGGQERMELFHKYFDQFHYRLHNSPKQRPKNPQEPTSDFVLIADMEGYNLRQLGSPIVIRETLKIARDFQISGQNAAYIILINANFFAERLLNIVKPALGSVFAKVIVHGTNKDNWIPKLLKKIPRESLGKWYGGFANYTPIAIYG